MRVFGMHDNSGCGWYRITLPLTELAAHGHQVKLVLGSDVRAADAAGWPLIVGQRIDKPSALPAWRRFAARSRLVYEIDDDVFHVDRVNWMAYGIYSRADVQDAVAHCAQTADLVTVTTEPLAEVMRQFSGNVAVLPNAIPDWACDLPREPRQRPAVGWAGGASHAHDIALAAQPVRRFLDRHPGWDMVVGGTDYRPTIGHARAVFTPWVKITDDPAGFYRSLDFDIGLAPLAQGGTGGEFNRSKSHIKALEYAARGIPVLASDAEPYRDFVIDGVTGFLIRYDHEWLKRLDELAADDGLRERMGAAAREHARTFTIENHWPEWEAAYEALLT
jgi:glycosyltransferase involved in cell wall biosynthesis